MKICFALFAVLIGLTGCTVTKHTNEAAESMLMESAWKSLQNVSSE